MASVLDMIAAPFEGRPRHCVAVPEWSHDPEKPFQVWFRVPNAATLSAVQKESDGDQVKYVALLVVKVAETEACERMFRPLDYKELMMRVDPAGLARLGAAILKVSQVDSREAEKN